MVGSFKHFHEESVNRRVTDQLEEEQVLQALQADGAQCWKSEEQLSKPELGPERSKYYLDAVKSSRTTSGEPTNSELTFPAALGISVCSRLPTMHRPFLGGAPLRWSWKVL